MKIVYCIAGTYNSGGMERVLANKANYLVSHGHDIIIVTTDQRGQKPFFPLDKRIVCYDLDINYEENNGKSFLNKVLHWPFKQWKHKKRLSKLLKQLSADVVISMFCNDASILPQMNDGSKKVLEVHFSRFKRLQYGRKGIWKFADLLRSKLDEHTVRQFDAFVVLTEEDRNYWGELPNIHVIPNAVSLQCNEPSSLTEPTVLAVGRLSHQKGFERLIEAWAIVCKKIDDWKLTIIGDGELRNELNRKIEELDLREKVHIGKNTSDMPAIYRNASILAMTSRYEGLPMVLLEAQVAGLPVVTFDCKCGPRDIIRQGFNGYIVPQGNINALAEHIIQLITNPTLRERLGKNAISRSKDFDPDRIMGKWNELFINLLKDRQ